MRLVEPGAGGSPIPPRRREVLPLYDRRRPQSGFARLWFGNTGIVLRIVSVVSVILAAYYKMDARQQVIEFRLDRMEKTLDRMEDRDKGLQEEIDQLLTVQSSQLSAQGKKNAH